MANDTNLLLIDSAFTKLKELEARFLKCESAFRAEYKGADNRTSRRKKATRERSRLYVPLIKTTVNILHAIFKTSFMNSCPIEISRVGWRSEHDRIVRDGVMAVVREAWKDKGHRVGLSRAVLSALYLPLGIAYLYYDGRRGKVRTKFVPITDLAFDELATDIEDVEHVAYQWVQSVREVKEKIEGKYYTLKGEGTLFADGAGDAERVKMKDIYRRGTNENGLFGWKLSSYCNEHLVREAFFKRLPFSRGVLFGRNA